jgi:hypothetical protein
VQTESEAPAARSRGLSREGSIRVCVAHVAVWEERVDDEGIRKAFRAVLGHMTRAGWAVTSDPDTDRNYPTLARWTRTGRKSGLAFRASVHGRSFELEFHSADAGRYGGKFQTMSPLLQRRCAVEMARAARRMMKAGYRFDDSMAGLWPGDPAPLSRAMLRLMRRDHGEQESGDLLAEFNRRTKGSWWFDTRGPDGWPVYESYAKHGGCYDNVDRDKKPMRALDVRCARIGGRLHRGVVAPRGGGNQWMLFSGTGVHYLWNHELFECERPDLAPRRHFADIEKRWERRLDEATRAKDMRRVQVFAGLLDRLRNPVPAGQATGAARRAGKARPPVAPERRYYVLTVKDNPYKAQLLYWFAPGANGYVSSLRDAGTFSETELRRLPDYYDNGRNTMAIPMEVAERFVLPVVPTHRLDDMLRAAGKDPAVIGRRLHEEEQAEEAKRREAEARAERGEPYDD